MLRLTRLEVGTGDGPAGWQHNMDSGEIIPIIGDAGSVEHPPVSRWRWWLHLAVLALFPLLAGVSGILNRDKPVTLLPASVAGLLRVSVFELVFFGVVFGIAWLASRVNFTQLRLSWRGGANPVWLGFAYSFALRVGITGLLGVGLGIIMLRHRSIWEAVIAHGFFNAETFAMLYVLAKYHPEQFRNF